MLNALTGIQAPWLVCGILLLLASVFLFKEGNVKLSLVVLTIGGFLLRLLMTNTDPFLYDWDEQYHALVARNLTEHPGTPMLYKNPLLPVDIKDWADNHIWLHKPPLFLWLIACSVKIFGATPFAVKLPSVLLSTLMIPAVYDVARRMFNERTGWIAAVLMASHSYFIQLVSGFRNTDHNDLIFAAFVLFSFWAWIRYTDTQRKRDAILTGVLVGCAILVKWLPGMLVYLSWGLWILSRQNRTEKKRWLHFGLAFVATVLLVVPWYIHTFSYFPAEAAYEMNYNMLHFSIAIEGHEGPWYYHLFALADIMARGGAAIIIPALVFLALKKRSDIRGAVIVAAAVFFFLFYTLAATKMPLFMLPIVPVFIIGIAVMIAAVLEKLPAKRWIQIAVTCLACIYFLRVPGIITDHSDLAQHAWYRAELEEDRVRALRLVNLSGGHDYAVFNYPRNYRAAHMFYTGQTAYDTLPPVEQLRQFNETGLKILVIDGENVPQVYRDQEWILTVPLKNH